MLFGKTKIQLATEKAQLNQSWRDIPRAEIVAKVKELVAEQHDIELDTVTDDLDFFQDLDDSLDFVELVIRCEEAFGVEIGDEDISNVTNVKQLTAVVFERIFQLEST